MNSTEETRQESINNRLATQEDKDDIYLSHQYRLRLASKPSQSNFRVLALLFFEEEEQQQQNPSSSDEEKEDKQQNGGGVRPILPPWISQKTFDGRTYVVGTNDEPGYMGGAICAERAAMCQLRFLSNQFTITKVVIATDSTTPISPGMLCREFLAGHYRSVPWDTPVLSTGCICSACGLKDEELFCHPNRKCRSCNQNGQLDHSLPILQTTIQQLYPYPSPYTRLNAEQSSLLGQAWSERNTQQVESEGDKQDQIVSHGTNNNACESRIEDETLQRLLELAILEAKSSLQVPANDVHPIAFGATALLANGTILTSHQVCGLEYGCTLDAISQLACQLENEHIDDKSAEVLMIVQADQYGIAHAPFAPARSFLSEHGYGDCKIMLHSIEEGEEKLDDHKDVWNFEYWKLRQISVKDLAPNAPSWTTTIEK